MKLGLPERPETVKMRKRLNKTKKKIQNGPRSHICQRHQKIEINPEETKLVMKLKKIRKAKKTQRPKKRKTQKNANKISVSKKPKTGKKTK